MVEEAREAPDLLLYTPPILDDNYIQPFSTRHRIHISIYPGIARSQMDEDTKLALIGFAVTGPLTIPGLTLICVTMVRLLSSQEANSVPPTANNANDDTGRKARRVSGAAWSSV